VRYIYTYVSIMSHDGQRNVPCPNSDMGLDRHGTWADLGLCPMSVQMKIFSSFQVGRKREKKRKKREFIRHTIDYCDKSSYQEIQ